MHILTQQTYLFQNRHIDQIMICTVFGVLTSLKLDVSLNKIIHCYGSQPQAEPCIWEEVVVKGEKEPIQCFHEKIFLTEMEPYFSQLQPTLIPLSNHNIVVLKSPVKVVTVIGSPLKNSPKKRSRGLFNVGQSPLKDLQHYNQFGRSPNASKVTRTLFPNENNPNDDNPAKRQKIHAEDSASVVSSPMMDALTALSNNALTNVKKK